MTRAFQAINKKCTENQTREIIKHAATNTDIRKKKIMELLQQIRHNQSPTINGFGLQVESDFAKVPARQLEPPMIQYAKQTIKPAKGVWRGEGMEFLHPQSAARWGIINTNYRTQQNELNDFARMVRLLQCLDAKCIFILTAT